MKKTYSSTSEAWDEFLKPALSLTAPAIGMASASKTKHPKIGLAAKNFSKSISNGKLLSLTDMQEIGLRLGIL